MRLFDMKSSLASFGFRMKLNWLPRIVILAALAIAIALASQPAMTARAQGAGTELVSNLSETPSHNHTIGRGGLLSITFSYANAFTTGSHPQGYRLNSVAAKFDSVVGKPRAISAKIYSSATEGGYAKPDFPLVTLTGEIHPDAPGDYTYTCSGSGCDLGASTTYHLAFETAENRSNNYYRWRATASENQTSDDGWTIADSVSNKGSGDWKPNRNDNAGMFSVSATKIAPALAASNIAATGATLTLSDYPGGDWHYKQTAPTDGTCAAAGSGATAINLTGLTPGTAYTYKAYSDSACSDSNEIESAAFTTVTLSASEVTNTTATLRLNGSRSESWRYKYTAPATPAGQCSDEIAGGTSTVDLAGLTPNTSYIFKAYSDGACANEITNDASDAKFTTENIQFSASHITAAGATLTIGGYTGNWYSKRTAPDAGTCSSAISGVTANVTGLTVGVDNTFKAYSDSSCNTAIAAVTFMVGVSVSNLGEKSRQYLDIGYESGQNAPTKRTTAFITGSATGGYVLHSVALRFSTKVGTPGVISVKIHALSNNAVVTTLSGPGDPNPSNLNEVDVEYTCSGSGCALSPSTAYYLVAEAPNSPAGDNNHGWRSTDSHDQTNTPSTAGWNIGDNSFHLRGSGKWMPTPLIFGIGMFRVSAMPVPHLGASSVSANSATLTLSDYAWDWHYKQTAPSEGTCAAAGSGATTVNLANLTPGVAYTFKAYSDSSCSNEITTDDTDAAFKTQALPAHADADARARADVGFRVGIGVRIRVAVEAPHADSNSDAHAGADGDAHAHARPAHAGSA